MHLVNFGTDERVVDQGETSPGIVFVVSGCLQVGRQRVPAGGHCCVESVMVLVQNFGSGLNTDSAPTVCVCVRAHARVCI
jgi:hypothetical protein